MNLTKVNGCYSKELREFTPIIKFMVEDKDVSVYEMIHTVKAIIQPAYINAAAKKRFVQNLEACKTKEEIDQLCHDAVVHGTYYKPKSIAV